MTNTALITRGLIDTPVLIDYRSGEPNTVAFMAAIRTIGRPQFSELSAMVLITNCADAAELVNLRWFFHGSDTYRITARISERAFNILDRLPPPCGLTADDAIVAATAVEHKLPLYTLDSARFAAIAALTALRPY
jgi:predicted nucleic acid-binding protein